MLLKIRLKYGATNAEFRHRNARYFLEASATMTNVTLGETVATKTESRFVFGRVVLLKLGSGSRRIKREYPISDYYFDLAQYSGAVNDGFKVESKANAVARLLVMAGVAELTER
jgi:hypothetical protein